MCCAGGHFADGDHRLAAEDLAWADCSWRLASASCSESVAGFIANLRRAERQAPTVAIAISSWTCGLSRCDSPEDAPQTTPPMHMPSASRQIQKRWSPLSRGEMAGRSHSISGPADRTGPSPAGVAVFVACDFPGPPACFEHFTRSIEEHCLGELLSGRKREHRNFRHIQHRDRGLPDCAGRPAAAHRAEARLETGSGHRRTSRE